MVLEGLKPSMMRKAMPTGAHITFIQEAEGTFEGGLVYNLQRHAPVGCCHQLIPHPLKVPQLL